MCILFVGVDFIRLGSIGRIHSSVSVYSVHQLTNNITNLNQLRTLYQGKVVVIYLLNCTAIFDIYNYMCNVHLYLCHRFICFMYVYMKVLQRKVIWKSRLLIPVYYYTM